MVDYSMYIYVCMYVCVYIYISVIVVVLQGRDIGSHDSSFLSCGRAGQLVPSAVVAVAVVVFLLRLLFWSFVVRLLFLLLLLLLLWWLQVEVQVVIWSHSEKQALLSFKPF